MSAWMAGLLKPLFSKRYAMSEYLHLPFAVGLLIAVGWTTLFSLTNKPAIRGFRNLGILASYISAVVSPFVAGWCPALVTWAVFGVAGGLLYIAWEMLERRHAGPSRRDPGVSLAPLIHSLFLWPIMVPEAVEYALADLGILRAPPSAPTQGIAQPGAAPTGDPATPLVESGATQGPPSVN